MSTERQYNFFDELIVDNFAGGGGASTGIELTKQKKAIEKELEEIEAQIGRVSDNIGEALLSLPEVSE